MLRSHLRWAFPRILLASVILVMPVASTNAAKPRDAAPSPSRAQIDLAIDKVRPALVRIRVVSTEFHDGREVKMQVVGSGAIITKDGYLVTNHHVAGHAVRIFCTLWNREEIEADLI